MTDPSSKIMTDALGQQIVQQTKLHLNLSQDAIVITEDKVKLVLLQHLRRLEAKKEWLAPAGVVVTLVTTFATTTFREFMVPASTWQAIFVIATLISLVWLFRAAWAALRAPTVEDVVSSMKRAGAATTATANSPEPGHDA